MANDGHRVIYGDGPSEIDWLRATPEQFIKVILQAKEKLLHIAGFVFPEDITADPIAVLMDMFRRLQAIDLGEAPPLAPPPSPYNRAMVYGMEKTVDLLRRLRQKVAATGVATGVTRPSILDDLDEVIERSAASARFYASLGDKAEGENVAKRGDVRPTEPTANVLDEPGNAMREMLALMHKDSERKDPVLRLAEQIYRDAIGGAPGGTASDLTPLGESTRRDIASASLRMARSFYEEATRTRYQDPQP